MSPLYLPTNQNSNRQTTMLITAQRRACVRTPFLLPVRRKEILSWIHVKQGHRGYQFAETDSVKTVTSRVKKHPIKSLTKANEGRLAWTSSCVTKSRTEGSKLSGNSNPGFSVQTHSDFCCCQFQDAQLTTGLLTKPG